ncbi:HMA2 domain-containing protein [Pontibacillus salicampi]|uniref:HMA2 domain-containing protein n=1 Tax=Pontibacillus salicampi TaxID=1449801 RepID=A0ABV6LQ11_9BACI
MDATFTIIHDIPGRLRLIIPALYDKKDYEQINQMFSSIKGIEQVRIEPIIQSMVISYNQEMINKKNILRFISLFFKQTRFDPLDNIMVNFKPNQRKDFLRSLVTGILLLVAYLNKSSGSVPGMLDYAVVISTAYTVLSHGENHKLRHPDVITGIVSMLSLGVGNILHVAMVTWAVNALELLNDANKSKVLL